MTDDTRGGEAGAGSADKPSPDNVALLKEAQWIAEQTRVLRKPRRGETEWQPDLDALGDKIGRTTGALKALRTGGDPELLTLRKLLAYALERIPGYNSVRFAHACGLLYEDHVLRYAHDLTVERTPASDERGAFTPRREEEGLEEVSPEDLETALRVSRVAFRGLDARVRDRMRQLREGWSERPPNTEQDSRG